MTADRDNTNPPWRRPFEPILGWGTTAGDGGRHRRVTPSIWVPLDARGRPILPPHLRPPTERSDHQ